VTRRLVSGEGETYAVTTATTPVGIDEVMSVTDEMKSSSSPTLPHAKTAARWRWSRA